MADITFECSECKQHLVIDSVHAGSGIQCPNCSRAITVPPPVLLSKKEESGEEARTLRGKSVYAVLLIMFASLVVVAGIETFNCYRQFESSKYLNSGRTKCSQNDWDGAMSDFNKAIDFNPQNSDAYEQRASLKLRKLDYDGAIVDFDKVIRLKADSADTYDGRAIAEYNKGEYDQSLADFNEVTQLNLDYPNVYRQRGNVEYCKGALDGALADYNKAIAVNTNDADAYFALGNLENGKGDFDGALGDYEKAIQIRPDFTDAITARNALKSAHEDATPELSLDNVKAIFQDILNGNFEVPDEQGFSHTVSAAQYFFHLIYPVGTGKDITVDDVVLNKDDDGKVQSVGLRLILDWQGPVQSGSATFQVCYDFSSKQFENLTVISHDGITRSEIEMPGSWISDDTKNYIVQKLCSAGVDLIVNGIEHYMNTPDQNSDVNPSSSDASSSLNQSSDDQ